VAEGLPEEAKGIGDSRENDRDRNVLTTGNSLRVQSSRTRAKFASRQNFDANQSN